MPDRAALVTGASSGIGLAIARALAEDGYGVTMSARRPDKLEGAVDGLTDDGLDVHAVPANMSEEEEIKALAAAHRDKYGRLDVLVNNAGIGIGGEIAFGAWRALRDSGPVFMLLDDADRFEGMPARRVASPEEAGAVFGSALPVLHRPLPRRPVPGRPDPANARAVITAASAC